MNMSRFIHPLHASGLRSPRIPTPTKPLSDKAIIKHTLNGFYGEEAKQRELKRIEEKKKRVRVKRVVKEETKIISLEGLI